ncbi:MULTISPECIES: TlpA family protein disulfide reductase [Sphingobacterium]|uniref:TlpA family protein disulfide reductase n=1 Tax=Sphingobacterium TaxID=28453 RepID=UPI0013DAD3C8|nr:MULTISPECIES: TlpA disulfide reductase family protein [unclassified Sphingobacterium]
MKYILSLVASIFLSLFAYGKSPYATVKGSYKHDTAEKINLYTVVNGELVEYATTKLGENGSFAFALIPDEYGFYYIGDLKAYFRIYLLPNQTLSVAIDAEEYDIKLVGKNNRENMLINQWFNLVKEMDIMATKNKGYRTIFTDFYPELERRVPEYRAYLRQITTKNAKFNQEMTYLAHNDIKYLSLQFLSSGRFKHPEVGNVTPFHKEILQEKLLDSSILKLPYAWRYLNSYSSVKRSHILKNNQVNFVNYVLEQISDTELKSQYLLKELEKQKNADSYNAFFAKYNSYFQTVEQKNTAQNIGAPLMSLEKGSPAINFIYPDINGNAVSLSDFKGKVVVLDVWATWCGPCIAEVPALQKLEKDFERKDVVFMSVSVDAKRQKWETYVNEKKLTGVQLWGDHSIMNNYKFDRIPRFMVFDKEGKIVSVDAPRPSDPALKKMLEKELAK